MSPKKDSTVAQNLYANVRAEFRIGNLRINKGEILDWTIPYTESGVTKLANGDTKARKLRLLIESNYLGVEMEHGQAWIIPAKGKPQPVTETATEPPQAPTSLLAASGPTYWVKHPLTDEMITSEDYAKL